MQNTKELTRELYQELLNAPVKDGKSALKVLPAFAACENRFGTKQRYRDILDRFRGVPAKMRNGLYMLALMRARDEMAETMFEYQEDLRVLYRERFQILLQSCRDMSDEEREAFLESALLASRNRTLPAGRYEQIISSLKDEKPAKEAVHSSGSLLPDSGIRGAKILWTSSRRITLELDDDAVYETAPYRIYINRNLYGEATHMIQTVTDLQPDTEYSIVLERGGIFTSEIRARTLPETATLNVREFGAYGDGEHNDTGAIQAAILSCPPGGRVFIPAGHYPVTALFLKSDIILEIGRDAQLLGIYDRSLIPILPGQVMLEDESDYLNFGTWEGNPLDMFASLITGIHVSNVTICGEGVIDGRADFDTWWKDTKHKDRAWRPRMIFLNRCSDITVQGLTVQNSPAWNLHPYFSSNIRFLDMKVLGPANSHNTDGCDPESCKNVEIAGILFSVGDDCIAVKSGKIYMGRKEKQPCENLVIRQSLMRDGHGGVTVGSEIAGGVRNLRVEKCRFQNTDRGLRVKTRRGRGKDSILEDIRFSDIFMDHVKAPFVVNSFYYCDPDGHSDYVSSEKPLPVDERTPEIRSLSFEHIRCTNAHYCGAYICGLPEKKIGTISFSDVEISYADDAQEGIAVMMDRCRPTCRLGIVLENVEHAELNRVIIKGQNGEPVILHGVEHPVFTVSPDGL